jgi:molybdopterin-guanine dinucleotide biosynthesis protein A
MGGADKGLQPFRGQALALNAVQRLARQAKGGPARIAINANRNLPTYATWGYPVWPDASTDYAGPLAGFLSSLRHCTQDMPAFDYLLTVPCDVPLFPLNLLERMAAGLMQDGAEIAVAMATESTPDGQPQWRAQPVFCLMHTRLVMSLDRFVAAGGRKVNAWISQHHTVQVLFDHADDDPRAFANANTLDQLRQLEQP